MRRGLALLVLLALSGAAMADAPTAAIRPLARPEAADAEGKTVVSTRGMAPQLRPGQSGLLSGPALPSTRPPARPDGEAEPAAEGDAPPRLPVFGPAELAAFTPRAKPPAATEQRTVVRVIRGPLAREALNARPRPAHIGRLVKEQATVTEVVFSATGSVCGDPAIKGSAMQSFGRPGSGCGVEDPVKITSVQGIPLTRAATVDCQTAKAFSDWVRAGLKPAMGREGGGVGEIRVVADYSCRNRNNARSGRLSEHAQGRALDIAGIVLKDGTQVSVLKGWGSKAWGAALQKMHKAACGPFGTVLGPNANAFHRDHFHFDTARYRSGTYCR